MKPISGQALYEAILQRRSVRRYENRRIDVATRTSINDSIAKARPLVPDNELRVLIQDAAPGENFTDAFGAYGRITNPPHYLVPYLLGETALLTDLGYRVEQIVVRLTALGLGTCYIGALHREGIVKQRFAIPSEARIGAFVVFGHPSSSLAGKGINRLMKITAGSTNKLPQGQLFYLDSFKNPTATPSELAPLIEAARSAPSAVNAQPWRFLYRTTDAQLHLFIKKNNPRYGGSQGTEYRYYDGGICLGNIGVAMEALGFHGTWALSDSKQPFPGMPADLEPLAYLKLRS